MPQTSTHYHFVYIVINMTYYYLKIHRDYYILLNSLARFYKYFVYY